MLHVGSSYAFEMEDCVVQAVVCIQVLDMSCYAHVWKGEWVSKCILVLQLAESQTKHHKQLPTASAAPE